MKARLGTLETFAADIGPKVDSLVDSSVVEKAVKAALKDRSVIRLSLVQRVGACTLFAIALVDFVKGF